MSLKNNTRKKSRFSKKSKKAWRVTDIKDVENFYENQLLEQRLGGPFSEKPDEALFFIQSDPLKEPDEVKRKKLSAAERINGKKKRALEPPRCFMALENSSMVPDPISKRNRSRTKEERKSAIQKDIEEKLRKKGIVKKKEVIAARNRLLNKKRALKKRDPFNFNKDVWKSETAEPIEGKDWLEEDTVTHFVTNTGKLKVKAPKSILNKPSVLPTIEKPHPGISYNPSRLDHNELLQMVAEKESKMIKEEEHLQRVTTSKFSKITRQQAMDNWLAEMSQGLKNDEADNDEEEDTGEYKPVNPPALLKRKPLKKKKKAKVVRAEELEKKKQLIEKKKLADLYKLKFMEREILQNEVKSSILQDKRKAIKADSLKKTKTLGPIKFSEPLPEFQRPHELKKNLRLMKTEGSILTDRFYSLQKRNIIEPRLRVRRKKTKVKRFFKPGHKVDDSEVKKLKEGLQKVETMLS